MKQLFSLVFLATRTVAAVVDFSVETIPMKLLPEGWSSDLKIPVVAQIEANASLAIPSAVAPTGIPALFPFHDEKATSILISLYEQNPDEWKGQMLRTVSSAYAIRGRIVDAQSVSRRLFHENTNKVDSLVLYAKMLALDPETRPSARELIVANLEREFAAERLLPLLAMIDISSHDWNNGRRTMSRLLDHGARQIESLPRIAPWILLFLMVDDDIESNFWLLKRLATEIESTPKLAFSETGRKFLWLSAAILKNKADIAGVTDVSLEASLSVLAEKGVPVQGEFAVPLFGE